MEQLRTETRASCWQDMIERVKQVKTNQFSVKKVLSMHKKYIHASNVQGRHKYNSLRVLNNFCSNPNRADAHAILVNTINKRTDRRMLFESLGASLVQD